MRLLQTDNWAQLSRPRRRFPEFALGDGAGTLRARGGATVVKVGGTISRAERAKKFFDPPPLAYLGGT